MMWDHDHFRFANVFNDGQCKYFSLKKPVNFMTAGVLHIEGVKPHKMTVKKTVKNDTMFPSRESTYKVSQILILSNTVGEKEGGM